jgi:hypothetical protein
VIPTSPDVAVSPPTRGGSPTGVIDSVVPTFDEPQAKPERLQKEPLFVHNGRPIGRGRAAAETDPKPSRRKRKMDDQPTDELNRQRWMLDKLNEGLAIGASDLRFKHGPIEFGDTHVERMGLSVCARVDGVIRDLDSMDGEDALASLNIFRSAPGMTSDVRCEPDEKRYFFEVDGQILKARAV